MQTRIYEYGRTLVQRMLEEWPGTQCDATDGARLYLAHSCVYCGCVVWPLDELLPVPPNQTICDGCLAPHVLTFVDRELLISTLQELVFAWPTGYPRLSLCLAQDYLRHYTYSPPSQR